MDKLYRIDSKGKDGWELVGRINDKVYLKRPIRNKVLVKIDRIYFRLRFFLRMKFDTKFRNDINDIEKRFNV